MSSLGLKDTYVGSCPYLIPSGKELSRTGMTWRPFGLTFGKLSSKQKLPISQLSSHKPHLLLSKRRQKWLKYSLKSLKCLPC